MKISGLLKNALPILLACLGAFIIITILSLLFSALICYTSIDEAYLAPAGVIITVLGLLAGGYLAGRRCKKNGLLNGLFLGVLYFLILWLLSAIGGASIVPVLTKLPYILLAPMIGGILGVK